MLTAREDVFSFSCDVVVGYSFPVLVDDKALFVGLGDVSPLSWFSVRPQTDIPDPWIHALSPRR